MTPSWPPSNMIVRHAATQVQLSPAGGGLQAYFIAPGGVGHSGPYIPSFSQPGNAKYPTGGAHDPLHRHKPRHRQTGHHLLPRLRKEGPRQHLLPGHPVRRQQALRLHRRRLPQRRPRSVVVRAGPGGRKGASARGRTAIAAQRPGPAPGRTAFLRPPSPPRTETPQPRTPRLPHTPPPAHPASRTPRLPHTPPPAHPASRTPRLPHTPPPPQLFQSSSPLWHSPRPSPDKRSVLRARRGSNKKLSVPLRVPPWTKKDSSPRPPRLKQGVLRAPPCSSMDKSSSPRPPRTKNGNNIRKSS